MHVRSACEFDFAAVGSAKLRRWPSTLLAELPGRRSLPRSQLGV